MDNVLLCVGFAVLVIAVFLSIGRVARDSTTGPSHHQQVETERHDTFTNEEILLPGVDIRHSHARRQIAEARRAQLTGRSSRINYLIGDPVDRDEIVDGEVVDEPRYIGIRERKQMAILEREMTQRLLQPPRKVKQ